MKVKNKRIDYVSVRLNKNEWESFKIIYSGNNSKSASFRLRELIKEDLIKVKTDFKGLE